MASKIVRKTVLITGCSVGGIGDALAQSFHKKGLRVYATARRISKMNHLKEMGIETLELDVQNTESIEKAVEFVQKTTEGTLDILVNNAGIGKCKDQKSTNYLHQFSHYNFDRLQQSSPGCITSFRTHDL